MSPAHNITSSVEKNKQKATAPPNCITFPANRITLQTSRNGPCHLLNQRLTQDMEATSLNNHHHHHRQLSSHPKRQVRAIVSLVIYLPNSQTLRSN